VEPKNDIREFLSSRRARITPQQAGLPVFGDTRRVPGLRREEAAMLAGVSVDYYTKMERGNLRGVSDSVLDALARGLRLDEAERVHLFDLARAAGPMPRPRSRPAKQRVRPSVQRILDAMTDAPALVQNARLDIFAANRLGSTGLNSRPMATPTPKSPRDNSVSRTSQRPARARGDRGARWSTTCRPMSTSRPYLTPEGQVVSQLRHVRQRSRCRRVFPVTSCPSSICLMR